MSEYPSYGGGGNFETGAVVSAPNHPTQPDLNLTSGSSDIGTVLRRDEHLTPLFYHFCTPFLFWRYKWLYEKFRYEGNFEYQVMFSVFNQNLTRKPYLLIKIGMDFSIHSRLLGFIDSGKKFPGLSSIFPSQKGSQTLRLTYAVCKPLDKQFCFDFCRD